MSKFGAPSLKKFLEYTAAYENISQRAFLRLFFGLTSLYLANIRPNSKFHPPPTKILLGAPLAIGQVDNNRVHWPKNKSEVGQKINAK